MPTASTDTLVAIATAPGRGGVGIVRLSGKCALTIAKTITNRSEFTPRYAYFCQFHDASGDWLDEGLALYFPAPHSFTGEEVVELQGHGGPVVLDLLVKACVAAGARQAGPGEFSLRAFLNDKMDLTQAEAIADMIDAGSEKAARAAHRSLQGDFSNVVNALVEQLVYLRMRVESCIDFPEEEIDFLSDGVVAEKLAGLLTQLQRIETTAQQGRLLRDGMTLVLAGKPNAGKSSLLNALAGVDAAIVTDQAGTTRDILREQIQLDGIPLNLIDTAGLRSSEDAIEQEGIRRAGNAMRDADGVVFVVDAACDTPNKALYAALPAPIQQAIEALPFTWVLNKADVSGIPLGPIAEPFQGSPSFSLSAKRGEGLEALKQHLKQLAGWQDTNSTLYSARRRHLDALAQCREALEIGQVNLQQHQAGELLAEDLRAAQQALESITGIFTADDLLGEIFSSFCIGK